MKLFEHPDFEQSIIRAAQHFQTRGLRESVLEKDYYVTEALRIIANAAGDKVIFKGGTSLSKGWGLIQRFSEDVDIFVDPSAYAPPLGTNAINRQLKKLSEQIGQHPTLTFLPQESQTLGGIGRNDRFQYQQRFAGTGDIKNNVFVEIGTASGREPTEMVMLQSYVGQFLHQTKQSLGADDEHAFPMRLLHFRRTFVEKLFTIHGKVERLKTEGQPIGSYARHYYDLLCLADQPEVLAMLQSAEYADIKADYDQISRLHFPKHYIPPANMSFAKSDALFPSATLRPVLQAEFDKQCKILCFGPIPTWTELEAKLDALRSWL